MSEEGKNKSPEEKVDQFGQDDEDINIDDTEAITTRGHYNTDTGAWVPSGGMRATYKPMSSYVDGALAGAAPSKWTQMKKGTLKAISTKINTANLLSRAQKKLPNVKFLRSGKQWGVIVG